MIKESNGIEHLSKAEQHEADRKGLTLRSVVISLAVIVFVIPVLQRALWYQTSPAFSDSSVPSELGITVVMVFLVLNMVLRKVKKRFCFA